MNPLLEIRCGAIGYGSVPLVAGLDLRVHPGEFICLLGPNGAGKSTLLRVFAGLSRLLSGDVLLDGRNLRRLSRSEISRRVAVVLTDSLAIPGMTVGELVRLGRHPFTDWTGRFSGEDAAIVAAALAIMDLEGWEDRRLSELSDGERQRAAIARALAQRTDILLLDEPTTFLDLTHRAEILGVLRDTAWKDGRAVVAALHDLDLAMTFADRIWLFDSRNAPPRILVGAPEDILLTGSVGRVFSSDTVRYDPFAGSFGLREGVSIPVRVFGGDGMFRHLADRVVKRAGGIPTDSRDAGISLECPSEPRRKWTITGPGGANGFGSLEEVATELRRRFSAPGS